HTSSKRDWSSDVCSSDLLIYIGIGAAVLVTVYSRADLAPYPLFVLGSVVALMGLTTSGSFVPIDGDGDFGDGGAPLITWLLVVLAIAIFIVGSAVDIPRKGRHDACRHCSSHQSRPSCRRLHLPHGGLHRCDHHYGPGRGEVDDRHRRFRPRPGVGVDRNGGRSSCRRDGAYRSGGAAEPISPSDRIGVVSRT